MLLKPMKIILMGKSRLLQVSIYNNHPEICVIDNGPGISEENIDEIFVPFFTTRQNGSGIGLSISQTDHESTWRKSESQIIS